MKKLLVLPALVAAVFFFACSDDSSSSNAKQEPSTEELSEGDSTRVLVYSYDKFLSPKDVSILDEDTINISIDTTLAKKGAEDDDEMPRVGNVIVIWEAVNKAPYYLRVNSVKTENGRLVMKVDKATFFEAIPKGDYHFSTELFFDTRKIRDNDGGDTEIGADVFYDEENATYHPIVFINGQSDENGDGSEYGTVTDNPFHENFDENGVIDMRKMLKNNFSVDRNVKLYEFEKSFTPGVIAIPGLGYSLGDYQGFWFSGGLFAGRESMEKSFEKWAGEGNENYAGGIAGPTKAYIKLGTVRYKTNGNAHLKINTSWWGRPELFEFYFDGTTVIALDSIGFGLGMGISGEKKLTNFSPMHVIFQIGPVPVNFEFTYDLFFKYNLQSYALLTYPINLVDSTTKKYGLTWKRGESLKFINQPGGGTDYNKAESFTEFVNQSRMAAIGNASAGLYFRVGIMFCGAGGPTFGIGARLDLDVETATSGKSLFDEEGSWIESDDVSGHLNLNLVFPLEVGGRVQIPVLHTTLFERSYDVAALDTIPLLNLNTDDK